MSEGSAPGKLSRRKLIKRGLVGGGLLALAGSLPFALRSTALGPRPRHPLRLLTLEEHAVLAAAAAQSTAAALGQLGPAPSPGTRRAAAAASTACSSSVSKRSGCRRRGPSASCQIGRAHV